MAGARIAEVDVATGRGCTASRSTTSATASGAPRPTCWGCDGCKRAGSTGRRPALARRGQEAIHRGMRVIWSEPAVADLVAIHDYTPRDSSHHVLTGRLPAAVAAGAIVSSQGRTGRRSGHARHVPAQPHRQLL